MAERTDDQDQPQYERRASGWVIRCKRCGFTEPWGKYGLRLGAASWKNCTLARCGRCRRLCCHAVEKRPPDHPPD
jgi:hypothetical protein